MSLKTGVPGQQEFGRANRLILVLTPFQAISECRKHGESKAMVGAVPATGSQKTARKSSPLSISAQSSMGAHAIAKRCEIESRLAERVEPEVCADH